MIAEAAAAWHLAQLLHQWHHDGLTGHIWVRVDLDRGEPVRVEPRRYLTHPPDETGAAP